MRKPNPVSLTDSRFGSFEQLEAEWRDATSKAFPGYDGSGMRRIIALAGLTREQAKELYLGEVYEIAIERLRTRKDGPDPEKAGVFNWQNTLHTIPKSCWELVCCIWGNEPISLFDVGRVVWGNEDTKPATIRSAVSRLNTAMLDNEIPLSWGVKREQIYRE